MSRHPRVGILAVASKVSGASSADTWAKEVSLAGRLAKDCRIGIVLTEPLFLSR
jgi:hypothetical protein